MRLRKMRIFLSLFPPAIMAADSVDDCCRGLRYAVFSAFAFVKSHFHFLLFTWLAEIAVETFLIRTWYIKQYPFPGNATVTMRLTWNDKYIHILAGWFVRCGQCLFCISMQMRCALASDARSIKPLLPCLVTNRTNDLQTTIICYRYASWWFRDAFRCSWKWNGSIRMAISKVSLSVEQTVIEHQWETPSFWQSSIAPTGTINSRKWPHAKETLQNEWP